MVQKGNEMSHDDIWDDSALVNSWNEALDEYKRYHSIHASGGKLENLPEFQQDASAKAEAAVLPLSDAPTAEQEPAQVDHQAEGTEQDHVKLEETPAVGAEAMGGGGGVAQGSSGGAPMPPPQALLGSMQDEGLKRLLMSWYYAGYYTGLYEGQQQKS